MVQKVVTDFLQITTKHNNDMRHHKCMNLLSNNAKYYFEQRKEPQLIRLVNRFDRCPKEIVQYYERPSFAWDGWSQDPVNHPTIRQWLIDTGYFVQKHRDHIDYEMTVHNITTNWCMPHTDDMCHELLVFVIKSAPHVLFNVGPCVTPLVAGNIYQFDDFNRHQLLNPFYGHLLIITVDDKSCGTRYAEYQLQEKPLTDGHGEIDVYK